MGRSSAAPVHEFACWIDRVRVDESPHLRTAGCGTQETFRTLTVTSGVPLFSSDHLGGIAWVPAAVPGEKRLRCVAARGVEFFAQDFAADGEAVFGIAERAEERRLETGFAGDLSHDLHQAPTEAARVGFGGADFVVGVERCDIFREERGFVANRPGVPAGFLFDDGADERGVEGLGGSGFVGEGEKIRWDAHSGSRQSTVESRKKKRTVQRFTAGQWGAVLRPYTEVPRCRHGARRLWNGVPLAVVAGGLR